MLGSHLNDAHLHLMLNMARSRTDDAPHRMAVTALPGRAGSARNCEAHLCSPANQSASVQCVCHMKLWAYQSWVRQLHFIPLRTGVPLPFTCSGHPNLHRDACDTADLQPISVKPRSLVHSQIFILGFHEFTLQITADLGQQKLILSGIYCYFPLCSHIFRPFQAKSQATSQ